MTDRIIGVDFGTTNSVFAVMGSSGPEVISNREGERKTPSMVGFSRGGEPVVGKPASKQAIQNPERTIGSVRRHVGEEDYIAEIDGEEYTAEQLAAMLLRKIKRDAEEHLDEEVGKAVVTTRPETTYTELRDLCGAFEEAGFVVERILSSPAAAAMSYGLNEDDDRTVLVFDLGGGGFTVSVLEVGGGVYEVIATNGDSDLGGDDWDQAIVDWLVNEFEAEHGIDLTEDRQAVQRLRNAAERAKLELSSRKEAEIDLLSIASTDNGPIHLTKSITRTEFEALTEDLIERTEGPTEQVLEDADLDEDEIDEVLFVGGATRMPQVREKVEETVGKHVQRAVNIDECVALGAAIQGGVASGAVDDCVVLDNVLCPLDVEIAGDRIERVVEADSTVPIESSVTVPTEETVPVSVRLLWGNNDATREVLWSFDLISSSNGNDDSKLELDVSITENGFIEADASPAEQSDRSLIIENESGALIESKSRISNRSVASTLSGPSPEETKLTRDERKPTTEDIELLLEVCDDLDRALAVESGETDVVQDGLSAVQSNLTDLRERGVPERIYDHVAALFDDVSRAVSTDPENRDDLRQWINIARQRVEHALNTAGVKLIDPDRGAETNPHRHEVIATKDADLPSKTVAAVEQVGCEIDGTVERPARVIATDTASDSPGRSNDDRVEDESSGGDDRPASPYSDDPRETDRSVETEDTQSMPSGAVQSNSTIGPWPMKSADPKRTGLARREALPDPPIVQRWRYETGLLIQSSPAVVEGTVYLGSDDTHLHAIDSESGKKRWKVQLGDLVWCSPAVDGEFVYVGDLGRTLYAIDTDTGRVEWTWESVAGFRSSPAVVEDTVYIGCDDHHVYAIDAGTGRKQWGYRTDAEVDMAIAADKQSVYATNATGTLVALEAADGGKRWEVNGDEHATAPAVANDHVYVASPSDGMSAYDRMSGALVWTQSTPDPVTGSPAIDTDRVYIGCENSMIALDPFSGDVQWSQSFSGTVHDAPALTAETVCVGTDAGRLYWLDSGTGEIQHRCETNGTISTSPALGDGTVYVGCSDCSVYAFESE